MTSNKLVIIYGTRPEAIKFAPLIKLLREQELIDLTVICSGQHKDMLHGILDLWNVAPDVVLELEGSSLSGIPKFMQALEPLLAEIRPELVLVQGDTFTAAAGALASHSLAIPVGHLEAGLRSGDLWNPFPEESNRRIIDSVASLHFAPTEMAAENLRKEGHAKTVVLTGNTIVDAVNFVSQILEENQELGEKLEEKLGLSLTKDFILFTQHRRESFGEGQLGIYRAIKQLGGLGHVVVFPVHQNPKVKDLAQSFFADAQNVKLIPPQEYLEFLYLLKKSQLIISDSGGLQEEAPSFGKAIVITRTTTERSEVVQAGYGLLAGYDTTLIVESAIRMLDTKRSTGPNPFGDGRAADKTQEAILEFFGNRKGGS